MTDGGTIRLISGTERQDTGAGTRIVRWDRFEQGESERSLPRLVAEDWRALRGEYLRWIGETGTADIRERLRLPIGPSVWWMTLMAEKSPMKSRTIYRVMKLRALEKLCAAENISAIDCRINDKAARQVIADWCAKTGIGFTGARSGNGPAETTGKRLRFLPHPLRGLIWLISRWWQRAVPARAGVNEISGTPEIAIASYFPNCDMEKLRVGAFRSAYWQELHQLLEAGGRNLMWIWFYAPSDAVSFREARTHRNACIKAGGNQKFMLAEEVFSPTVMLRALWLFLILCLRSIGLMRSCGTARIEGSDLALGPVLKEDWKTSLRGIVAAEAAWYIALFDALARKTAPQTGLYVFENQNWESALVDSWRKAGTKKILAHQHEAIKPLNLRLFEDKAAFEHDGPAAKPFPDRLAVGSKTAIARFREGGWPENRITPVESLRFKNAGSGTAVERQGDALLLIAGYLPDETQVMLDIAATASEQFSEAGIERIIVKPHPFLPVENFIAARDFAIDVTISTENLEDLWDGARLVFAANSTAAVFDAMAAGLPVCVCAPDDDLNLSPALGIDAVRLIGSGTELSAAAQDLPPVTAPPSFLESSDLKRWSALLAETP